jgi:beta-ribofuranosylaminobenzene 5'-phosphate synthase
LSAIRVTAPARLHLGFLDLNGGLNRRFGSIGLAIDAFETLVELRPAAALVTKGHERERAQRLALRFAEALGLDPAAEVMVREAIPAHAGLGSGTQLAIAIASAFRRRAGLPPDPLGDARLLDRGARSGVGAALFEHGGLVVDAGRGPTTDMPPVISHLPFPEEWRILLLLDRRLEGAHGEDERRAFAALPPFPASAAAEICRRLVMQILPGVAERDLDAFGEGVSKIQELLGDYFAPAQGGGRFTSSAVGRVAARLRDHGAQGVGQSSWGPTGFAFAADSDQAECFARLGRECDEAVEILIAGGVPHGARITDASAD